MAIDFTMLEKDSRCFENMLVINYVFTKFPMAVLTRVQKAPEVSKVLMEKWFLYMGIP